MAQLDKILEKYVKPGAEAQGLQGAAFIVKDRDGMFSTVVAFRSVLVYASFLTL